MNRRKQVLFSTLIIYERSEFWKFFVLLLTLLSIEKTLKCYIESSKLHCIYQDLHFKQPITNLVTYLFSIWRYFEKTKVCKIVSSFHPLHLIEKCYFSSSRKVLKGCNWVINVWWVKISSCSLLNLAQGEPNHQRKKRHYELLAFQVHIHYLWKIGRLCGRLFIWGIEPAVSLISKP